MHGGEARAAGALRKAGREGDDLHRRNAAPFSSAGSLGVAHVAVSLTLDSIAALQIVLTYAKACFACIETEGLTLQQWVEFEGSRTTDHFIVDHRQVPGLQQVHGRLGLQVGRDCTTRGCRRPEDAAGGSVAMQARGVE